MKTTNQIAIEYAQNRAELKAVKAKIQNLLWPLDENGNLIFIGEDDETLKDKMDKLFTDWFDPGDYDYEGPGWPEGGWVTVVSESDIDDPDVIRLAALWEQRKNILREAGKIKRAFWARGAKLLREQAA